MGSEMCIRDRYIYCVLLRDNYKCPESSSLFFAYLSQHFANRSDQETKRKPSSGPLLLSRTSRRTCNAVPGTLWREEVLDIQKRAEKYGTETLDVVLTACFRRIMSSYLHLLNLSFGTLGDVKR